MSNVSFFCYLSNSDIADFIASSEANVVYAAPGIHELPARALAGIASKLGPELTSVSLDFDEAPIRMGFGTLGGIEILREAGIHINHAPKLRNALIIVDRQGFAFTPTALFLEAESSDSRARNALRLTKEQVDEALMRLSPASKEIAKVSANSREEKERIDAIPLEVQSEPVDDDRHRQVSTALKESPPVPYNIARQVRVYQAKIQYIDISLEGLDLKRRRIRIPNTLQTALPEDLEDRVSTTVALLDDETDFGQKFVKKRLNEIREGLTRSLGQGLGRVLLREVKGRFEEEKAEIEEQLGDVKNTIEANLTARLDDTRAKLTEYYLPQVMKNPPIRLRGEVGDLESHKDAIRSWIDSELTGVFPTVEELVEGIRLEVTYKDVTFETLNDERFIQALRETYPYQNWDRAHDEFLAAGERTDRDH